MKKSEIKISIGGLMRCCLATLDELDDNDDFEEGQIVDCEYEKPGNRQIILLNGKWKWNSDYDSGM